MARQIMTPAEFGQAVANKSIETPEQAAEVTVLRGFPGTVAKAVDPDNRVIEFIISDESVDRMDDRVMVEGWELEPFNANPVVLFAHDNWSPPVGRGLATFVQGTQLVSRAQFMPQDLYPFSYMLFRMYMGGYMRAVSVGFIPKSWRVPAQDEARGYGVDFVKQELTEYSCVPVPANPNALMQARGAGIDTAPMKSWAERALDELNGNGAVLDERRKTYLEQLRKDADPTGMKLIVALRQALVVEPAPEPAAETKGVCETHGEFEGAGECPKCAEDKAFIDGTCERLEAAVALLKGGADKATVTRLVGPLQEIKAGRVLSAANEDRLRTATTLLSEVLAQLEPGEDDAPADDQARGLVLRQPYVLTIREVGNEPVLSLTEPAPAAGAEDALVIDRVALAAAVRSAVDAQIQQALRRHLGRVD